MVGELHAVHGLGGAWADDAGLVCLAVAQVHQHEAPEVLHGCGHSAGGGFLHVHGGNRDPLHAGALVTLGCFARAEAAARHAGGGEEVFLDVGGVVFAGGHFDGATGEGEAVVGVVDDPPGF